MKPLKHPDNLHLRGAQGWLELGDHQEALRELTKIRPAFHRHPDVLEVRWLVFARAHEWRRCVDIANSLIMAVPGRVSGWLHLSYALHELKLTQDAYENLSGVAKNFPHEMVIRYNLACYCCQLGRRTESLDWLRQAMSMGDAKQVMAMAVDDPDLATLVEEIRKLKKR